MKHKTKDEVMDELKAGKKLGELTPGEVIALLPDGARVSATDITTYKVKTLKYWCVKELREVIEYLDKQGK